MKTFIEFLEGKLLGNQNMKLVGGAKEAGKEIAIDTVAGFAGPLGGVAKTIAQYVWNNRRNLKNKIIDDSILQQVNTKLASSMIGKQYIKTGKNLDELVAYCVEITDESQSYLSEEEKEKIREEIIKAANNQTLDYGFAQNLVNELLREKVNQIQSIIQSSPPKSREEMIRQSGVLERPEGYRRNRRR